MLKCKRMISAVMAVLMLTLSFVTVYADGSEKEDPTRGYATGVYNGCDYSLSSSGSSSTLLKSRGDYEVDINMKLRFNFRLCYPVVGGGYAYYGTAKTLNYGNYYGMYLTKSYTVTQAVNDAHITDAPSNSRFSWCTYSLLLDNDLVTWFKDTYLQV